MADLYKTEEKPITEADKLRLGADLAKLDIELRAKKEEKRKVNSNYRVQINKLEESIDSLSTQLDSGKVQFKFGVEEVPDDARQTMLIVRSDTREQVDQRPMNEAEKEEARKRRQPSLFAGESGERHDTDPAPPPEGARRNRGGMFVSKNGTPANSTRSKKKNGSAKSE